MGNIYRKSKSFFYSLFPNFFRKFRDYKIFAKYIISGCTAAVTDLVLLYIFTDILHIWYLLSAILAFIIAFFVSFYLQKYWTFRDNSRDKIYTQMSLYFLVGIINLSINTGGMYILVDKFNIMYILAQIMMGALIAVSSFLIYRFIIFKKRRKKKTENNRILIATGVYPPDIGGPATYAQALIRELPRLGYEVAVITYSDEPGGEADQIYKISRRQNILFRYLKYFWRVFKLAGRFDVIYALDLVSAGFPATLAAKLRNKKVVFRTGGDFLWEKAWQSGWTESTLAKYYNEEGKRGREKFLLLFCRWLLKKIDLIIFSTRLQADIYNKYYQVPESKIKLVSNAIPEIVAGEKNMDYENCLVFAGRLIKLKNIDRLIRAFEKINYSGLELLIFGEGPEREKLESGVNRKDKIKFKGNISHRELIKIISGCKFVILPSITEISPNLALECLSMAKPIILTRETGLDRAVMDKLVTVDPLKEDDIRKKIEFLLKEENLAGYTNALRDLKIKKRSWQDIAHDHDKIFKQQV